MYLKTIVLTTYKQSSKKKNSNILDASSFTFVSLAFTVLITHTALPFPFLSSSAYLPQDPTLVPPVPLPDCSLQILPHLCGLTYYPPLCSSPSVASLPMCVWAHLCIRRAGNSVHSVKCLFLISNDMVWFIDFRVQRKCPKLEKWMFLFRCQHLSCQEAVTLLLGKRRRWEKWRPVNSLGHIREPKLWGKPASPNLDE